MFTLPGWIALLSLATITLGVMACELRQNRRRMKRADTLPAADCPLSTRNSTEDWPESMPSCMAEYDHERSLL